MRRMTSGTTASTAGIASDSVHQDSLAGMKDAFLVRMDSSGNVQWATYFGGADNDGAISVAAVGKSAFITGETFSDSLVTDTAAHQWRYGGGGDVFIAGSTAAGHWRGPPTSVIARKTGRRASSAIPAGRCA
ncbi:MAG: hypothetical protein IPL81_05545 [Flavobacteriales bacterium]|nr:hypothetical protein [Flavobacteriales bacterium]